MPTYDIQKMREKTKHAPEWLHLGAGNLFRAYLAALQEKLLNQGLTQTGIIVAEGYDYEIIDEVFIKNDLKSLLVTLKHNGQTDNEMIYSVAEALKFDQQF